MQGALPAACNLAGLGALGVMWGMAKQVVELLQPLKMVLMGCKTISLLPRSQGDLHAHAAWHKKLGFGPESSLGALHKRASHMRDVQGR